MKDNKNNNKEKKSLVEFAADHLDENDIIENKNYPNEKPDVRFNPNYNRKEIDVVTSENQLR